jgi:hypothetical protein
MSTKSGLTTPPRSNLIKRKACVSNSPTAGEKPSKTQAIEAIIAADDSVEMTLDTCSAAPNSSTQDKGQSASNPSHVAQCIDRSPDKASIGAMARGVRGAIDTLKVKTTANAPASEPKDTPDAAQVPRNVTSPAAASSTSSTDTATVETSIQHTAMAIPL